MARCSRKACGRWRPDLLVRLFGLGARVDHAWHCSADCVRDEAIDRLQRLAAGERMPAALPVPLGAVLLQQKAVTPGQLKGALIEQRRSGLRLGDQLTQLGYSSSEAVLRALAAQSNVPYLVTIDPASVRNAPGQLSGDEVRALGLLSLIHI